MMKNKFQFYKNIILVVASALTLVAVTFAWFNTYDNNGVSRISRNISADLINVDFYEKNGAAFDEMDGDISLNFVSGDSSEYKMVITTFTEDDLRLAFAIDDLAGVDARLKNSVEIKYSLYKATKNSNGTFTENQIITSSSDAFVPLSGCVGSDGTVFNSLLGEYQNSEKDYFVMHYEIRLSDTATSDIQGAESALGSVRFSAQVA